MTMGDRVLASGLNFTMIRILLVFGWLRLIIRRELSESGWNSIDTIVVAWTVARTVNYTLVWGTWTAFVNRLGYAYNIVGYYFLFRYLIRTQEDVFRAIRLLAIFIGPLALLMVAEKVTGKSLFAIFGGVPSVSDIRDGVVRCQGPFAHPILAGTFGATMWLSRRLVVAGPSKKMAGVVGRDVGSGYNGLGRLQWSYTGLSRWQLALMSVAVTQTDEARFGGGSCFCYWRLQLVMNSPVWFLMATFNGIFWLHRVVPWVRDGDGDPPFRVNGG